MKKAEHHPALRKRVILVFLIAVIFPTIFLGYFGLTGIESEQQLQRQIAEQNLENSLQFAAEQLKTEFKNEINNAFYSVKSGLSATSFKIFADDQSSRKNKFINEVFLLDNDYQVVFPPTFLDTDLNILSGSFRLTGENEFLQRGEHFELNGQYDEAINEYNRGRIQAENRALALTFLTRIARCEIKTGRIQNAVSTYSDITQYDIDKENNSEITSKLIAYQQLLQLIDNYNSDVAGEILVSFYDYLVQNYMYLQKSQFDFYLNNIHAYRTKHQKNIDIHFTEKLEQLNRKELKIRNIEEIHAKKNTYLIKPLQAILSYADFDGSFLIEQFEAAGHEYLLAIKPSESENDFYSYLILTIDRTAVREFFISFTDEYELSKNFRIALKSENGWIGTSPNKNEMAEPISKNLSSLQWFMPDLSLALMVPEPAMVNGMLSDNINLIYLFIIAIILIIVLGLFFLFRDIYREEQLYRMKSDFISNVTHDIKTPISTMRTLAENLSEGWIKDPDNRQEYYAILTRESERLSQVVENILEFSRGEASKTNYEMKMVPFGDLANKIVERFNTLIQGKEVSFHSELSSDLPQIYCNPGRIEHAVLNLLDNALKFSGEDKEIEFRIREKDGQIRISVRDNGYGISKNELDKIFQKFYRVESRNGQNKPGSGIGLSLVRDIVNQHGGIITVDSTIGEGSTFSFSIPVNKATVNEQNSNR